MQCMETIAALMAALIMMITPAYAGGEPNPDPDDNPVVCDDPCSPEQKVVVNQGQQAYRETVESVRHARTSIDALQTAVSRLKGADAKDAKAREKLAEDVRKAQKTAEKAQKTAKEAIENFESWKTDHQGAFGLLSEQVETNSKALAVAQQALAEQGVEIEKLKVWRETIVDSAIGDGKGRLTELEGSRAFSGLCGRLGSDFGPNVAEIVGPFNGMVGSCLEIGNQDRNAEYFIGGEWALHVPRGQLIAGNAGLLARVHPYISVGVNASGGVFSYRIGGNDQEKGLGANKRLGKFVGVMAGPMARFAFTPPDSPTEFGATVRLNVRVGQLWDVYDNTETQVAVGFTPSAGLYVRHYFGPLIKRD